MFYDTHAHYDDEAFDQDRDILLPELHRQGITLINDIGCDIPSSKKAISIAEQYPFVYAVVGAWPGNTGDMTEADLEIYGQLAQHPKVVAIGEIGLDYHYDFSPRPVQQEVLRRQLALARELGLPAVLHNRESTADMLEILREFAPLQGVMHCFSGSLETMKILLDMGLYIGIGGSLTFKNSVKPVEAAKQVPQDRFLIETDSPYLAPVPMRGKRNEPSFTRYVAERLAGLRS